MKKIALSAMLAFAMVAAAAAQTSSSPSTSGSTDQNATPSATSSTNSSDQSAGATGATAPVSKEAAKTESGKKAKMTGCIQQEGTGYALVDKKHPNGVQLLSSEDLSAHVGHKVEVKGTWEAATASSSSSNVGTPENPSGISTSNTGAGATSAKTSKPEKNPYSTPVGNNTGTADMTPVGGKSDTNAGNNANALPQSDQASGQAIRVSEIKMKSDKCEMAAGTNPTR